MRTLITASEDNINASFDKRFGRAAWFCVYDQETDTIDFLKNENVDAGNGAGTKAAEKAVALKADKVISGDFGPKAKDMLDRFEVQLIVLQEDDLTIGKIIQRLKKVN